MKKTKIIFASILITFFFWSCVGQKTTVREKYTHLFETNNFSKPFIKKTFYSDLPRGFKKDKKDYNPDSKEIRYYYKDSIIIYITDNIYGSDINGDNKVVSGYKSPEIVLEGTSIKRGTQKDGKFWAEYNFHGVLIGYLNVPKQRKEEFEKAMYSIREVKN